VALRLAEIQQLKKDIVAANDDFNAKVTAENEALKKEATDVITSLGQCVSTGGILVSLGP